MDHFASFSRARVLLHHGLQAAAAIGRTLTPPQADDGHTSLTWEAGAFVGPTVSGSTPWRAALRVEPLSLEVIEGGRVTAAQPLAGLTRADARAWLVARAAERGAALEPGFDVPYELPTNDLASGATFTVSDPAAMAALASWFGLGDALLREVAGAWPGATPVRVWPHHFDVGSVLPLGGGHGEEVASLGIGLSPGDDGIDQPYFYVTAWPPPAATDALPPLAEPGVWHRRGWTGALLTAGVLEGGDSGERARVGRAFLADATTVLKQWRTTRAH
ncbi:MAG: hypothetical protein NDJ94_21805 [Vicinamibacteria bacterium]|nr:hypothetical protein [Vicinamibacteria bacterium]